MIKVPIHKGSRFVIGAWIRRLYTKKFTDNSLIGEPPELPEPPEGILPFRAKYHTMCNCDLDKIQQQYEELVDRFDKMQVELQKLTARNKRVCKHEIKDELCSNDVDEYD
jgi:hypothetical protein